MFQTIPYPLLATKRWIKTVDICSEDPLSTANKTQFSNLLSWLDQCLQILQDETKKPRNSFKSQHEVECANQLQWEYQIEYENLNKREEMFERLFRNDFVGYFRLEFENHFKRVFENHLREKFENHFREEFENHFTEKFENNFREKFKNRNGLELKNHFMKDIDTYFEEFERSFQKEFREEFEFEFRRYFMYDYVTDSEDEYESGLEYEDGYRVLCDFMIKIRREYLSAIKHELKSKFLFENRNQFYFEGRNRFGYELRNRFGYDFNITQKCCRNSHKLKECIVSKVLDTGITKLELSLNSRHMALDKLNLGLTPCYLSALIAHLPKLTNLLTLNLGRASTPQDYNKIELSCSMLSSLTQEKIIFPQRLQEFSASGSFVNDSLIKNLVESCNDLRYLDISRSSVSPKCIEFVTKLENLEEVFISDSTYYFFDDHIRDMLIGFEKIKNPKTSLPKLRILQCDYMSESNIEFLIEHFPHLEGLHLSNQTYLHLEKLHKLQNLKEFGLRNFHANSSNGIFHFSTSPCYFDPLYNFLEKIGSNLRYLKVEVTYGELNLTRMLKFCPDLECLHMLAMPEQGPSCDDLNTTLPCFDKLKCVSLRVPLSWADYFLINCHNVNIM